MPDFIGFDQLPRPRYAADLVSATQEHRDVPLFSHALPADLRVAASILDTLETPRSGRHAGRPWRSRCSLTEAWIATSYGALDLRNDPVASQEMDYLILSSLPSFPVGLKGEEGAFWRRLADGPVPDDELSPAERSLVGEFETFGLASRDPAHPARTSSVPEPWLTSPLHELVYSMVAHVAAECGADIVFIKGPALHRQGLRAREHSGDVDIWVDPRSSDELQSALLEWGWELVPNVWNDVPVNHSVTLRPSDWGCEIDIHRHFPGIALAADDAFARLRKMTEPLCFAGTATRVPTAPAHAVIAALHFARPSLESQSRSSRNAVARQARSALAVESLRRAGSEGLQCARLLRADASLAPLLRAAFPDETIDPDYPPPPNWIWRAAPTRAQGYFMALSGLPPVRRARLLFRLVWPRAEVALASDQMAGGGARSALAARVKRIFRGLRQLEDGLASDERDK
ncbi:MAG: nucleotidyltransferase family protein [Propioniciclava sp.]|uniref:hypothetical protein n=1 Tax=Propioniciclava sp. TaxID=2038686 RepID=UPI0039E2E7A6